jgi:hypothetical protein
MLNVSTLKNKEGKKNIRQARDLRLEPHPWWSLKVPVVASSRRLIEGGCRGCRGRHHRVRSGVPVVVVVVVKMKALVVGKYVTL